MCCTGWCGVGGAVGQAVGMDLAGALRAAQEMPLGALPRAAQWITRLTNIIKTLQQ